MTLGENGIKTLDDLGDLASDELIEVLGEQAPAAAEADAIIMAARAHWFDDEPEPEPEPDSAEDEMAAAAAEAGDAAQGGETKEA